MELSMPGLKVGDPVEVLSGRFAGDKGVVQFILREDQLLSPVIICSPRVSFPLEQPRNICVKLHNVANVVPFREDELERIEER